MKKYIITFLISCCSFISFSQKKDTIVIIFNDEFSEMEKTDFTEEVQAGSPEEKLKKSIAYRIRQMEKDSWSGNKFHFTHANHPKEAYKKFGGEPPIILKKQKSFLENKKVLDIEFFRTTPYIKVAKTFEEEDSWEEDVMIFMIDVDEIKNDSITLRQVSFTRPVKE
jgi:hypothetical protein|tara:strand:- start:422 stop:922 length:501 start_codon:yes stop_codon:yes gene_type:complete